MSVELLERAADLRHTADEIHADRGRRLTLYVRALDFACGSLHALAPDLTIEEHRSRLLAQASITARGAVKIAKEA